MLTTHQKSCFTVHVCHSWHSCNQVEFKKRLSNEGDITLVRKFEKRSSSSHGEEPNNCALAHCHRNNGAENFDRHVTQTL